VDTESGTVHLAEAGYNLTADPAPLPAGGPLGQTFTVADRAYVRRWDGADWLLNGLRYNLPDGITFGFSGGGLRRGEYWTFVARVEHPDGAARGWLETLAEAPAHGPVHHSVPLARITRVAGSDVYEDLRPRFLPLNAVKLFVSMEMFSGNISLSWVLWYPSRWGKFTRKDWAKCRR
jgi:hypothetical protein